MTKLSVLCAVITLCCCAFTPHGTYTPPRVADSSLVAHWEFRRESPTSRTALDTSPRMPSLNLTLAPSVSWAVDSVNTAGVVIDATTGGADGLFAPGTDAGIAKLFDSTSSPYGWNYTTEVWSWPMAFPPPGVSHTLFQLCNSPQLFDDPSIKPPCMKQGLFTPTGAVGTTSHSFSWQLVYEELPPSYLNKNAFGFSQAIPAAPSLRHSVARYTTTEPASFGTLGPGSAIGEVFVDGVEASDAITGSRITEGLPINMWEVSSTPREPNTWSAHSVGNRTFTLGFNYDHTGAVQSSSGFQGTVYMVALYDRALSDAEIAQNYQAGPPSMPPVASPAPTGVTTMENVNVTLSFPGSDPDTSLGWDADLSVVVTSISLSSPIIPYFPGPHDLSNAGTLFNGDGTRMVVGTDGATLGTGGPSLTFAPPLGFYGTISITYRSVDARHVRSANEVTMALTVTNVEHTPVAVTSTNTTLAGSPVLIFLDGTDLDPESKLQPTVTSLPDANVYGTLARTSGAPVVVNQMIPSGSRTTPVVFTPATDLGLLYRVPVITAAFTFQLTDSIDGSVSNEAMALVEIRNNAQADPRFVPIVEDTRTSFTVTGSDLADPGRDVTFKLVQLPAAGTLYLPGSSTPILALDTVLGSGSSVDIEYLPDPDFFGLDIIRFSTVSSLSLAESVPAVVQFNVSNVNDAPRMLKYQVEFFRLDGNGTVELLVNEVDSDAVTYSVLSAPAPGGRISLGQAPTGSPAIVGGPTVVTDSLDRILAFALVDTEFGTQGYPATVAYTAVDEFGLIAADPGEITVFVKHNFFAGNGSLVLEEDGSGLVRLPTADYFSRGYSAFLTSLPASGTLRLTPSSPDLTVEDLPLELVVDPVTGVASVTYVGARNVVIENDSFQYEIRDTEGRSEVVVGFGFATTTPVPDPPLVELIGSDPLVIVDKSVLAITNLVVAEVDDPAAILDVNITVVANGEVAPANSGTFQQTQTLSGTTSEIASQLLAPLRFRSSSNAVVTESTPVEVVVTAASQGDVTVQSFFVNVLPGDLDDDKSLDTSLVAAVSAAAATALLFGAVGAYLLWARSEKDPGVPPPPDFEPYIYDEPRLEGEDKVFASPPATTSMLSEFVQLLVSPGYGLVFALFEVSDEADIDDVCERLAFVFESTSTSTTAGGRALDLIASVAQREIEMAPTASSLFRSNSRACKLHSVYAKMVGLPYLYSTLGRVFVDLSLSDGSLEVDASKVRHKSGGDDTDVRINKWQLLVVAQKVLKAILESLDDVPYEFRQLAHTLSHDVSRPSGFPERRTAALGTFFFLRFVCPAIAQPEAYGLVREVPSSDMRRLLVLVAKTLQNLANGTEFKEDFLEPMNVFIRSNWDDVAQFLDDMAELPVNASGRHIPVPRRVVDASVHWLYLHTRGVEEDLHLLLNGVVGVEGVRKLDEGLYRIMRPSPTVERERA